MDESSALPVSRFCSALFSICICDVNEESLFISMQRRIVAFGGERPRRRIIAIASDDCIECQPVCSIRCSSVFHGRRELGTAAQCIC